MKPFRLSAGLSVVLLLTVLLGCNDPDDPVAPTKPTCRLTSVTNQLIESSGQLTNEMQRTFAYADQRLIGITEQSTSQTATFGTAYTSDRLVQTTSGNTTIAFTFSAGGSTPPASATFSQNGAVQSTFTLEYNASGLLNRLVETRTVLPANSLTVKRVYAFSYDSGGNLTTERVTSTLRDGSVVEQETEYTVGSKPSPYALLSERTALTLIALSRTTESHPAHFWHQNAPTAFKTYDLTTSGSRSTLRESTKYAPTFDADGRLTTQEQTALLYQASVPTPVTKKNRQTFAYQCN